ncbi:MAG: hypothetical protein WBA63_08410 [Thermomicrobiales bacterium]
MNDDAGTWVGEAASATEDEETTSRTVFLVPGNCIQNTMLLSPVHTDSFRHREAYRPPAGSANCLDAGMLTYGVLGYAARTGEES